MSRYSRDPLTGEETLISGEPNPAKGFGYATCTTAESTEAKEASLSGYDLVTGAYISVKFTNAVPANATLSVNSKTAKPIYYHGSVITAGIINAGDMATFVYDGTNYNLVGVDNVSSSVQALANQATNISQKVSGSGDEYSSSKAYAVGELCIHDNKVYRCITACSAASWEVNQNCFALNTLTNVAAILLLKMTKLKTVIISGTYTNTNGYSDVQLPSQRLEYLFISGAIFGVISVLTANEARLVMVSANGISHENITNINNTDYKFRISNLNWYSSFYCLNMDAYFHALEVI